RCLPRWCLLPAGARGIPVGCLRSGYIAATSSIGGTMQIRACRARQPKKAPTPPKIAATTAVATVHTRPIDMRARVSQPEPPLLRPPYSAQPTERVRNIEMATMARAGLTRNHEKTLSMRTALLRCGDLDHAR